MRECEAEQGQCHGHDFRRGAAGAQIEQRTAQQEQKDSEDHFGRPGDRRAQYRRMQDDKEDHQRPSDQRQVQAAKRNEQRAGEQRQYAGGE